MTATPKCAISLAYGKMPYSGKELGRHLASGTTGSGAAGARPHPTGQGCATAWHGACTRYGRAPEQERPGGADGASQAPGDTASQ